MYVQIHKYNLLNSFCCLCVCGFRVDHYVLDNQLGVRSLGNANCLPLYPHQLPAVSCPGLWPHEISSSCMAIDYCVIEVMLLQPFLWDTFSQRTCRYFWLLESFYSLFWNVPWTMGAEAVTQMHPLWLGPHNLLTLAFCPVEGHFCVTCCKKKASLVKADTCSR